MIGDCNNDAPVLAETEMGMTYKKPSSFNADKADEVILHGDSLDRTFVALDMIKTTCSRINQNIGWALHYNAIMIALASLCLINPIFDNQSTVSSIIQIVRNSLRSVLNKEFQQNLLTR